MLMWRSRMASPSATACESAHSIAAVDSRPGSAMIITSLGFPGAAVGPPRPRSMNGAIAAAGRRCRAHAASSPACAQLADTRHEPNGGDLRAFVKFGREEDEEDEERREREGAWRFGGRRGHARSLAIWRGFLIWSLIYGTHHSWTYMLAIASL